MFRLGPESKHILLKVKVAKYNFKSCNFYCLKCKESPQDCKSSKVVYFISLDKYYRHKNDAKINKRRKNILYAFIEYLDQYIFWNNWVLTTDSKPQSATVTENHENKALLKPVKMFQIVSNWDVYLKLLSLFKSF